MVDRKQSLDWDLLRVVLAVQRTGSLRAAAETLGVNHATVARAVDAAETALGTRLFDRSKQGLSLTQTGQTLVPHAEDIEANVLDIQRKITGLDATPSGEVRVSMPPAFAQGFFIPILSAFSEAYPDIEIVVVATNEISDLSRFEADVSIRATNHVDEDGVVGRRLLTYVVAAFASRAYLDAHPDLCDTQGAGAHWVNYTRDTGWIAHSPLPRAKARHVLPDVQMQLEAAVAGLGLAYVPVFMADHHPDLIRVPGLPTMPGRSIWILLHGDLRKTARVRAFVDFVADWIAARKTRFTR